MRLDQYAAEVSETTLSRSQAKKLIEEGFITVNGKPSEPGYKVKADDRVSITTKPPINPTTLPEDISLEIVYEDDDIVVVNKLRGMVTHPAPGNYSGTLVNALLHHTKLADLGAPIRPGIVHRLDKDTSGLLVVAKNDAAYLSLVKQIKNRTVEKTYLTLVEGVIKNNDGIIDAGIGRHPVNRKKMSIISRKSREAITTYHVLQRFKKYTLVEVKIKTGRTHQIRVHMSHLGHPVVGDATYGQKKNEFHVNGQLLHAQKLAFDHPRTGQRVGFEAKLPAEILEALAVIKSRSW